MISRLSVAVKAVNGWRAGRCPWRHSFRLAVGALIALLAGFCPVLAAGSAAAAATKVAVSPAAAAATKVTKPAISSVSPAEAAPGWQVTVHGRDFTGVTSVTFGGVAAKFTAVSSTKIEATVPGRATAGPLSVKNKAGQAKVAFTVTPVDSLVPGQAMTAGDSLTSSDGHYTVVMQDDGNLVEYVTGFDHPLWATNTAGHPGAYVVMQDDGNLVVYDGGTPLWASNTGGDDGAAFYVQTDANLVVYQGSKPVWASGSYDDTLQPGEYLKRGWFLESSDRHFTLIMQDDGNLVEYVTGFDHPLWASNTGGKTVTEAIMQDDGNLVVYDGGTPLWASNTGGDDGAAFYVQTDANLVVYQGSKPVWASGSYDDTLQPGEYLERGWYLTSGNGYQLIMQDDGNLVLYDSSTPLWASNTGGKTVTEAIMQDDGNLVVYDGSTPLWASNTGGHPGAYLIDQQDGNQVIYDNGKALWASNTAQGSGSTGGYPYANAVCYYGSAGGSHCEDPSDPGDEADWYDWGYWDGSTFDFYDSWGYEYRNCTSYVAWRLSTAGVNAALFRDLGNADQWIGSVSGKSGVVVNQTPSPGAVAVWDSPGVGHVAWVDSVSGGTVTVSDYNYAQTGAYAVHTISSAPTAYIHFP